VDGGGVGDVQLRSVDTDVTYRLRRRRMLTSVPLESGLVVILGDLVSQSNRYLQ
jgi:hypothetical protein